MKRLEPAYLLDEWSICGFVVVFTDRYFDHWELHPNDPDGFWNRPDAEWRVVAQGSLSAACAAYRLLTGIAA